MHKKMMVNNEFQQLTSQITSIIETVGGTWGIALLDLDTKESWELNAHKPFYSASIIKIPIMIALFTASERREIKLSDTLILKREDQASGSGVLQYMTPGTRFTIYDLIILMIIQSDNTATNMLINLVGVQAVQETMKGIGLVSSKFYHKMMTVEAERKGLNEITAHEMTEMLQKLTTGKIISIHACEQMINILKKQQIRNLLPARIPEQDKSATGAQGNWSLANKTGNVSGIQHDIGIFYEGKRIFIASVLSKGLDDLVSPEIIGQIGLAIHNYLRQKAL